MSKVLIENNKDRINVNVWNRVYTIDNGSSVLSSIVSNGHELLQKPISLYMECEGKACTFGKAVTNIVNANGVDGKEKVIIKAFESESAVVNIEQSFYEDGCNRVSISVMPKGRSVTQAFLGVNGKQPVFKPNKLYLDVYLNDICAEYYQVCPIKNKIIGEGVLEDDGAASAGFIPKTGFISEFKEQVYINGDDCGLAFIFRDDEKFEIAEKERAVEFIKTDSGENLLRFHFLDRIPKVWDIDHENDINKMLDCPPISFKFGVIATPVKEYDKENFYERNLHLDCFKKIPRDMNYDEFLASEVIKGSGENGYDRLKRLGVEVLYIHEKWNDIQNSPFLTEATVARAKTVIEECHKRGIKVIPYFGYEFSSLSPMLSDHADEFWQKHDEYPYGWYWYRYPYQRAICACLGSNWSEVFYEGLCKLYDELGFDGLYFDTTVRPTGCKNTAHGCGYIDDDGNIRPTHPVWEIREFIKKIYAFVKSRGGTMNIHGCGAANMTVAYYGDSLWEGETFQGPFMNGSLREMPEGMLRGQFTGRDTGNPVYSLCYENEPIWSFKSAAALYLLHGSIPKPVDIGEPLERMSVIWDALDKFPLKNATWKPYWKHNENIEVVGEGIKATAWETNDEMLLVCASTYADSNSKAKIKSTYKNVFDVLDGYKAISNDGSIDIAFKGIDYNIFYIKK